MSWHTALLALNVISMSLILVMAWLMIFKMPEEVQHKRWHTWVITLLVGGFFVRVSALLITLYALGPHHHG